jgi:undecaprenyl-diphosphatase
MGAQATDAAAGVGNGGDPVTLQSARNTLQTITTDRDYRIMRRLNRWRAPRWFRWWMLLATRAGDGWLWAAIGIALLVSSDPMRFRAVEAAGFAVGVGILIFLKVKGVVCRIRPRDLEPHCWANIVTRDRFSFPSGHSTTAFAVAISLGLFYPAALPLLLVLASMVAVSRVVVGMHFLSDVIVGSGMGATLGYIAFRFAA